MELANYYSPKPWLIFDGDVSWSRARFTEFNEAGQYVPEAVDAVVSGGASIDNFHRTFASLRLRYFGPRALIEDNSVQSKATTLLNFEGGYQFVKALRVNAQVYNLLDAEVSDIDYYFASRLPGEPLGGSRTSTSTRPCHARCASAWSSVFRERWLTPNFQFSNSQEIRLFWELGVGCWAFDAPQECSPAAPLR